MRNAIKYYYNIQTEEIKAMDDFFLFDNFMLKELKDEINFDIYYKLISNNIKIHQIVFNIYNVYYTKIKDKYYVLYKLCDYCELNISEIINYTNLLSNIDITGLKVTNSVVLWENKTDYYEKYIFNNNSVTIQTYGAYYIGLSELAIRLYKENVSYIKYSIVHKRIGSFYDFFCPDNFIIDSFMRDYVEIFKTNFFIFNKERKDIIDFLLNKYNSKSDWMFFFSRLCFPTYYFDSIYNEDKLENLYLKINQFEKSLYYINKEINKRFGIEIIKWLKKI